jgi:hypothetical protein
MAYRNEALKKMTGGAEERKSVVTAEVGTLQ